MHKLKSALFALAAVTVAGGAFAQSDPKLISTVVSELNPNEVTLSRNLGQSTEFIGRAAWRVTLKNGSANALNNASFTAEAIVLAARVPEVLAPGALAPIDTAVGDATTDVIHVAGTTEHCKLVAGSTTKLSCDFTDGQLGIGEFAEFIVVVRAPTIGGAIKLLWTFGGDEGKGNGNGCCTKVASAYTDLIDAAAANSTVKTHVQSFMVKTAASNRAFTGVAGGTATTADPWTTVADLGTGFLVGGIDQSYTKITVDEIVNPTNVLPSCSALNKNQCWVSNVSIPSTTWTPDNPLLIQLNRHSSIIKNGSKLGNYVITYSKTGAQPFTPLKSCSLTGTPAPDEPCLVSCVEIPLATQPPTFIWSCNVKALNNGSYSNE